MNNREYLKKFDVGSEKELVLGYSPNSHAYRMFNKRNGVVMAFMNVTVEDTNMINIEHDGSLPALQL